MQQLRTQFEGCAPFVAMLSRRSIVPNAAGSTAVRLADVVAHVAVATAEVQAPAAGGFALRTTPVVAA